MKYDFVMLNQLFSKALSAERKFAYGMAVGHSFRRSGFLCLILSLLLLYRGITIYLGQPQMLPRLDDDFDLVLRENSAASANLNSITASRAERHIVSPILRKGFFFFVKNQLLP